MTGWKTLLQKLIQKKKILIVGVCTLDHILVMDKLPESGGDVQAVSQGCFPGGCGYNVADVMLKLGLSFDHTFPVGKGRNADILKELMNTKGIPSRFSLEDDNGICYCLVETGGKRSFVTVDGVEAEVSAKWFEGLNAADYDLIYLSGYEMQHPGGDIIMDFLQRAKTGSRVIIDLGPRFADIKSRHINSLINMGALFSMNSAEAIGYTKSADLKEAGHLSSYGATSVISLGAEGVLVTHEGVQKIIPAFDAEVVDTIGAGDALRGGIMAGLACEMDMYEAVLLGNKIASVTIQRKGGGAAPTLDELNEM